MTTTPRTLHLGAVYCNLCKLRTSGIYYGCENGHHYVCIVCFSSEIRCPVNDNDRLIKTVPQQGQAVPTARVSGWQLWRAGDDYCNACSAPCISRSNISYHYLICQMGDYDICQECFSSDMHCFDSTHLLTRKLKFGRRSVIHHIPDGTCHSCRDGKFINYPSI